MLLAAGAVGGLGNPHFVSRESPRPKYATKGENGMKLCVQLELKLLADVGLVGLPNAGKSTLLRALSNSRARIGDWAFTTLQPNIGTVVLDDLRGRRGQQQGRGENDGKSSSNKSSNSPLSSLTTRNVHTGEEELRTSFTIADIPGLIEDAHLDKGLGISFLRHVERAGVLAFVVDLAAGDAVAALRALWTEVGEYDGAMQGRPLLRPPRVTATATATAAQAEERTAIVDWDPMQVSAATAAADASAAARRGVMQVDASNDRSRGGFLDSSSSSSSADYRKRTTTDDDDLVDEHDGVHKLPPLVLPPITSKPWFVVANKADRSDTQANFARLAAFLADVESGVEGHPSGCMNAWRSRLHAVPVSAIRAEGVDRVVEVIVELLEMS